MIHFQQPLILSLPLHQLPIQKSPHEDKDVDDDIASGLFRFLEVVNEPYPTTPNQVSYQLSKL